MAGSTRHPIIPLTTTIRWFFKIKETTAAGPWSISYYDAQGRVVKSESLGYSDSQNVRVARTLTGYDRYGRKTATTLPFYETNGYAVTPSWIQLSYDLAGRPVTEEKTGPDGLPSTTTYTYQGETTTLSYADYSKTTVNGIHGKPKSITENGLTIDYSYDPLGNLLTTSTGGLVTTLEYDERGNKIKQDDPSMGLWEYDYNAFGELIWQKDAKAQETTFEYDELGRQKTRTDVDGVTTWSYYTSGDGIGQLQQETGTHATKSWAYNADGLVASEILTVNGKTFATGFEYDAYSRLITKNEDNGQTLHYDYDNTGAIRSVSVPKEDFNDFNFDVLKTEYDVILTQIVDIEAQIVGLELQAQNHYKQAVAYAAQVSYFSGLLEEVEVQMGLIEEASQAHLEMADRYMEEARIYREQADALYAQFGDKEFRYKGEKNGQYEFEYKKCTKKKSSLLGKKCKRYEYYTIKIDSGELNLVDVNAGQNDRSIKHSQGYEVSTSWITPKSEEVRTITYRAAKPWQIYSDTADAWQALADIELEAANAAGATIESTTTHVYMPVEVFRDVWVPIAGEITFFVFVEDAKFIENQWVEMQLGDARVYYNERIDHYQLLAEQALDDYQELIDGDGEIIGIAELRDDLSELIQSQVLFEENLLALGLDPDDLDSAAQDQADATAANNRLNVWMATMRTANGALERELFGNGLRTVRDINDDNGLVDRITTSAFSGTVLRDVEYDYNSRGQIISKHDVTTERYQTTETFGYNGQNQLTSWNYDQTVNIESETTVESLARTYSYDNRGNMTFKTGAGTMGYNSANNRLDTRTLDGTTYNYHYDANGNMTSGDNRSYTWNAFNKVEQVIANGQTVDFEYDASRSRVLKDTADETIYYVNKGYEMIVRKDSAGLPTETIHRHQVWNGHDVVATYEKRDTGQTDAVELALESDQIAYYHRDIIGSGEVVTGSDMEVLSRRFYTPYGELIEDLLPTPAVDEDVEINELEVQFEDDVDYMQLIEDEVNPLTDFTIMSENLRGNVGFAGDLRGYTSHEEVAEVGLVNMNARLYDPVIGRFVSADTMVPSLTRPLAYNRYAYVEGNPVSSRDPTGHFVWFALAFYVAAHDTDNQGLQIASTIMLAVAMGNGLSEAWGGGFWGSFGSAATTHSTMTLLRNGTLTKEDIRNSGWAGLAAGVANYVGHGTTQLENMNWADKAALHGVTQGGISLLRGDGFAQGAVSGYVGHAAGHAVRNQGNIVVRTFIASGAAYISAEAAGGNGSRAAVQAALVHLYNAEIHLENGGKERNEAIKEGNDYLRKSNPGSEDTIVIGEDMSRVIEYAENIGADWYGGLGRKGTQAEYLVDNIGFIVEKMDQGYTIIDIGPSPDYKHYPQITSIYYYEEIQHIANRNGELIPYKHYKVDLNKWGQD